MTQRERLLAVFSRRTPDRLPWVVDVTYWLSAQQEMGRLPEKYRGPEGYLRLHEELGMCAYFNYFDGLFRMEHEGVDIDTVEESGRRSTTWRTGKGALRQEETYLPEAYCWGITKYAVETPEDLPVLRSVIERRRYSANTAGVAAVDKAWGDLGYPSVIVPRSPLPALLTEWAGVQNLVYMIVDAPEEIDETLRVLEEVTLPAYQIAIENRPALVHLPDNLSSENSTGYFDRYMRGYYERCLAALHEAGIPTAVHLDGTIKGLLPKLGQVGFDAVEALTPQPVGDASVDELRSLAGRDDLILWGGVPGAMFAPPFTADDMRRHVRHLLETCGHSPFILGSADQVPPNGDIEMCRMIAEMAEEFTP